MAASQTMVLLCDKDTSALIALSTSNYGKFQHHADKGDILINDPLLQEVLELFSAASFNLLGQGSLKFALNRAALIVPPMSKGLDSIHFAYIFTISFRFRFPFPFIKPFRSERVNSPSSVIYPGATLKGPPPGICIDFLTLLSSIRVEENSRKVPLASPIKAPIMHPKNESFSSFAYSTYFCQVSTIIIQRNLKIKNNQILFSTLNFKSILCQEQIHFLYSFQYYDSVHLASDQKDLLISQLKAEIFEIQQRDKDYLALRDQLHNIQSKYRHLQDEKLLQDNDFKTKHDSNNSSVMGLKKEIDDLRFLLNEKNRANSDMQQDIATNREHINRKEMEITQTQRDVSAKQDNGYQLRKEIDNLSYEVQKLKEEKAKELDEIQRLRELQSYRERENSDQNQRLRALDYDLLKAQERASDLNKIADTKEMDLRRTADVLDGAQAELSRLKDEHQRLQGENVSLQRQLERQNEEKGQLLRARDGEMGKNREVTQSLYDLEARNRSRDDQILQIRKEIDDIRFSNSSMLDRNNDCKAEIDALNAHIRVLEGQNRDLNIELEKFVETDEQIRNTLNRRDRVVDLRTKTEVELQRSMRDLERSSPQRRHR